MPVVTFAYKCKKQASLRHNKLPAVDNKLINKSVAIRLLYQFAFYNPCNLADCIFGFTHENKGSFKFAADKPAKDYRLLYIGKLKVGSLQCAFGNIQIYSFTPIANCLLPTAILFMREHFHSNSKIPFPSY